jgi:hypothetical protein
MSNVIVNIVFVLLILFCIGILILQVHEKVKYFPHGVFQVVNPLHHLVLISISGIFAGLMKLLFQYNWEDFFAEWLLLIACVVIWDFVITGTAWIISKIKYKV